MHQEIKVPCSPPVEPLLHWYEEQARILPWREHPDPYHVWISEIMLQQTRVEAVKPYYERFLRALPDIPALAQAGEEPLMKLWEGLGYYSRVRNLQKAARIIVKEYDGRLPADFSLLQKLPGIGPYTAGAIASIAYGIPAPAVDGNVLRVVSRLCASRADISNPKVKKMVEQAILEILPPFPARGFQSGPDGTGGHGLPAQRRGQMRALPLVLSLPGVSAGDCDGTSCENPEKA